MKQHICCIIDIHITRRVLWTFQLGVMIVGDFLVFSRKILLILYLVVLLLWYITCHGTAFFLFIVLLLRICWWAQLLINLVWIFVLLDHILWIFWLVLLVCLHLIKLGLGVFLDLLVSFGSWSFLVIWDLKLLGLRTVRFAVIIVFDVFVACVCLLLFNDLQFYLRCCFARCGFCNNFCVPAFLFTAIIIIVLFIRKLDSLFRRSTFKARAVRRSLASVFKSFSTLFLVVIYGDFQVRRPFSSLVDAGMGVVFGLLMSWLLTSSSRFLFFTGRKSDRSVAQCSLINKS